MRVILGFGAALLLAVVAPVAPASAQGVPISALPAATPLPGSLVPCVVSGVTSKCTVQQILQTNGVTLTNLPTNQFLPGAFTNGQCIVGISTTAIGGVTCSSLLSGSYALLSPGTQQTGFLNLSGPSTFGSTTTSASTIGTALTTAGTGAPPSTCNAGDKYLQTAGAVQHYTCVAANTWVPDRGQALPIFDVRNYGAAVNGTTNDATADQAAITAACASAVGGTVLIPGISAVGTTLVQTCSNVTIIGYGADANHDISGAINPVSALKWVGSSGGTILQIAPVPGASAFNLARVGVHGIAFEPNALAGYGLKVLSVNQSDFSDLSFGDNIGAVGDGFSVAALYTGIAGQLGEHTDTETSTFERLECKNFTTTGACFYLDGGLGPAVGDTSIDRFDTLFYQYKNGPGIVCNWADNVTFSNTQGFGIGTGEDIQFLPKCSSVNFQRATLGGVAHAYPGSFGNRIDYLDYATNGGPLPTMDAAVTGISTSIAAAFSAGVQTVTPGSMTNISNGTWLSVGSGGTLETTQVTAITGSTFTATFLFAHGTSTPVAGAPAAQLSYSTDNGLWRNNANVLALDIDQPGNVAAYRARQAAAGGNTSLFVSNVNSDHIRLDDGTNQWGLNIDGSGNLRFSHLAGTGVALFQGPIWSSVGSAGAQLHLTNSAASGTDIKIAAGDPTAGFGCDGANRLVLFDNANVACRAWFDMSSTPALHIAGGVVGSGASLTSIPANQFAAASFTSGACDQATSTTALGSAGGPCVDTVTNQTIAGNKTFSGTTSINGTTILAKKNTATCTMSSATTCTATATVSSGSTCVASYDAGTTATFTTLLPLSTSVSSTTLSIKGQVSGSAVSTAFTFDYVCL